jgi:hypothetical protein
MESAEIATEGKCSRRLPRTSGRCLLGPVAAGDPVIQRQNEVVKHEEGDGEDTDHEGRSNAITM